MVCLVQRSFIFLYCLYYHWTNEVVMTMMMMMIIIIIIIIIIISFNDKLTSATHYNIKYRSNNVELIVNK